MEKGERVHCACVHCACGWDCKAPIAGASPGIIPNIIKVIPVSYYHIKETSCSLVSENQCSIDMAGGAHTLFIASPSAASLGDGDVLTIANELLDVAPRWELLARCLNLSKSDITNIKTRYGEDVNQALVEVISRWIATNSQLTWPDLVQALRQPILNEEWRASQIEDKFCIHRPTPCKLLNYIGIELDMLCMPVGRQSLFRL